MFSLVNITTMVEFVQNTGKKLVFMSLILLVISHLFYALKMTMFRREFSWRLQNKPSM
jgi:hypothetical protein